MPKIHLAITAPFLTQGEREQKEKVVQSIAIYLVDPAVEDDVAVQQARGRDDRLEVKHP